MRICIKLYIGIPSGLSVNSVTLSDQLYQIWMHSWICNKRIKYTLSAKMLQLINSRIYSENTRDKYELKCSRKQACHGLTDTKTPEQEQQGRTAPRSSAARSNSTNPKGLNHGATTFLPAADWQCHQPLRQSACKLALQSPSTFLPDPNRTHRPARVSCFHHFSACPGAGLGQCSSLVTRARHTGSPEWPQASLHTAVTPFMWVLV